MDMFGKFQIYLYCRFTNILANISFVHSLVSRRHCRNSFYYKLLMEQKQKCQNLQKFQTSCEILVLRHGAVMPIFNNKIKDKSFGGRVFHTKLDKQFFS